MKYSVIIPIYNSDNTLTRCVDSFIKQEREDVELLLINDGSTDRSEDICREYQKKYGNIRYFSQKNCGVSAARNVGLAEAKGEYVIFTDSDDFVSDNYLNVVDNALVQHNADLLLFGKQYTTGKAQNSAYSKLVQSEDGNLCKKAVHLFRNRQLDSVHAKVFRRDIISQQKILFRNDLSVGEDSLFVFEYVLKTRTVWADNIPVYYIDISNGESLTRRYRPYLCDQLLEMHKQMACAIESCGWPEKEKQSIRAAVAWSFYRSVYSVCKDLRKSNMTPKQRRKEIRSVCSRFLEKSIKPAEWKCQLIAFPVRMHMVTVIDWMTGLR